MQLRTSFPNKWKKSQVIILVLVIFTFLQHYIHSTFPEKSSPTLNNNRTTLDYYKSRDSPVHSLCSAKADERGLNQNVVSYSLYGPFILSPRHFKRYVSRLKENAERIKDVYEGWNMRIYIQSTTSLDPRFIFLQEYFHGYPHVDVCNATGALESLGIRLDVFPMTWRFLPLFDPTVNRIMSRDADSLVLDREVDAVNEWLLSGTSFHIMRDYVGHCVTMLGGMWGADLRKNREKIVQAASKLFSDPRLSKLIINNEKGLDQQLLDSHIWPLTLNDNVSHDSYCCANFDDARPFPTQRKGEDYVGKIHSGPPSVSIPSPCPDVCKPPDHPDWTYC